MPADLATLQTYFAGSAPLLHRYAANIGEQMNKIFKTPDDVIVEKVLAPGTYPKKGFFRTYLI